MVCEGNQGNTAQKLVITSERETYLSSPSTLPIKRRQHTHAFAKKTWAQMQEDLIAAESPVPGDAMTVLPHLWELGLDL